MEFTFHDIEKIDIKTRSSRRNHERTWVEMFVTQANGEEHELIFWPVDKQPTPLVTMNEEPE